MIKQYYLVPENALPNHDTWVGGEYHYIDLESHGPTGKGWKLLVLKDPKTILAGWQPLPHLLEQDVLTQEHTNILSDLGITQRWSMYQVAKTIGSIHPEFKP